LVGICLLLVAIDARTARDPQAEDDDGDGSDDAMQIADQVTNAAVAPQQQVQAGPSVPAPVATAPVGPAIPAVVSMAASSLNRFGKQHVAASPAAAAPIPLKVTELAKGSEKKEQAAPTQDAQAAADAKNAHIAAKTAKQAAKIANKVAVHSVQLTDNAKTALENAHEALHKARVGAVGLSAGQKQSLKTAEAKLKEATKKAEYGQVKNAKYVKAEVENKDLQKLEEKMSKVKKSEKKEQKVTMETDKRRDSELEAMRKQIEELRKELKSKEGDKADDDALLKDLEDQIKQMEAAEKKDNKHDQKSHDEMKAEVERLRAQIKDMEDTKTVVVNLPTKPAAPPAAPVEEEEEPVDKYKVKMQPLVKEEEEETEEQEQHEVRPVEQKGIDIDTAMPYGDLEPFGREDTAQELTESSITQSDEMVDQLERAEVAEEKRSVFRALTRLRGAAITSFDGVARSQTGNIDEYNKVHKWRNNHPLHHLADEESDVSKWAFPDNAD